MSTHNQQIPSQLIPMADAQSPTMEVSPATLLHRIATSTHLVNPQMLAVPSIPPTLKLTEAASTQVAAVSMQLSGPVRQSRSISSQEVQSRATSAAATQTRRTGECRMPSSLAIATSMSIFKTNRSCLTLPSVVPGLAQSGALIHSVHQKHPHVKPLSRTTHLHSPTPTG